MKYEFPYIDNIEQVREAIKGRDEFIESDKGDHIIFNYLVNFADTFPPVLEKSSKMVAFAPDYYNETAAILRECRGFIFDKESGKPIARRYHKFFNLNEKPETGKHSIDWRQNWMLLEKLDGSMITPYYANGRLCIGTKMGETDVAANAKKFIEQNQNYLRMIEDCIQSHFTPIFEWCSRKNRIVIDYPEDRLVLTGLRNTYSGIYLPHKVLVDFGKLFSVEVVKVYPKELLDTVKDLEDGEGYVIRFEDGHMVKVKSEWYVHLHRLLDSVKNEKDIIPLILNDKLDDAKAFFPDDLAIKLDNYGFHMTKNIWQFVDSVVFSTRLLFASQYSDKEFAEAIKDSPIKSLFFSIKKYVNKNGYSGKDALREIVFNIVKDNIIKSCSTKTKVEEIRHIIKVKWDE